jgi:hypothetical protein
VINLINEISFYLISVFFLSFTNLNPYAESKLAMGWITVGIAILNVIYPNGHELAKGCLPECIEGCKRKIKTSKRASAHEKFEQKRQELIEKYKLKLKNEIPEKPEQFHLKRN